MRLENKYALNIRLINFMRPNFPFTLIMDGLRPRDMKQFLFIIVNINQVIHTDKITRTCWSNGNFRFIESSEKCQNIVTLYSSRINL